MGPGRDNDMTYADHSLVSHLAQTEHDDARDRALAAARASFPELDIIETFGGFMAVPKGTVIVQAVSIDGLTGKLRAQQ